VLELAPQKPRDHLMVMNMSGRSDKDIFTVDDFPGFVLDFVRESTSA
jgi:tryptophan synthase beta chain